MSLTAVALGHSYIQSVSDHFRSFLNPHNGELPVQIPHCLKVDKHVQQIHLLGIRGATMDTFRYPPELQHLTPDIIIIEMGSNDLAHHFHSTSQVQHLAHAIVNMAQYCLSHYGASHVVICSSLKRLRGVHNQTLAQYNANVYLLNNNLKTLCKELSHISYHRHSGFWADSNRQPLLQHTWSRDGIHPNTDLGRLQYKRSLRDAILRTLPHTKVGSTALDPNY